MLAGFILKYEQMWQDVGNTDPFTQAPQFKGIRSLYSGPKHLKINPNLTATDYLYTFKEFMRIWAARKHEGSPEKDWERMQMEFAEYINEVSKRR